MFNVKKTWSNLSSKINLRLPTKIASDSSEPLPLSMSRSHPEEPGTGADRAAEETRGAGEILSGLLCCPEGVFTETSDTQTTQSHAGMYDGRQSPFTNTQKQELNS